MIEKLLKLKNTIANYNKDENVPYEDKNYYIVMICTIPILIISGLIFHAGNHNAILRYVCYLMAIYTFLSTFVALFLSETIKFSYIFCIILNCFVIPSVFYLSVGVYYGIVLFFVLGIILETVLLGRQKKVIYLIIFQLIYDISLIFYSYLHNDRVYMNMTNLTQENAIALSFVLVSVIIIFLFAYQNYIYKEIRLRIEKDNESILKAENTKGRFLANMTHEIRTPMNAIIGMTDIILKEELSKNAREYADGIKVASAQLLQIINNILEFSKLDSGRAELINNVYSFKDLIEQIVSEASSLYAKDEIMIHVFISKDIPDKLFGDAVRIKQVLRYLLFSPLSRSTNGMVNLEVGFEYDDENRVIKLKFRIASTGGGLTSEEMVAIYNAYSNYDSRQKTDYNRTGLEFSICEKILGMMGGKLSIDSIEGIGNALEFSFINYVVDDTPIAEFNKANEVVPLIYISDKRHEYAWQRIVSGFNISATYVKSPLSFRNVLENRNFTVIYLPSYSYPELKEYIEAFDCEEKVYIISLNSECYGDFGKCRILRHPIYLFNFLESINGTYDVEKYKLTYNSEEIKYPYAKVLCVDDTLVNLTVLENLLREYDIIATTVSSGKDALELMETNVFDLLIIDQKMPEMDGIELISRIKQLPNANASIPAICATADFGASIKDELELAGFDDYLAKPINIIYLEKMLKLYLPEELKVTKVIKKKKGMQVTQEQAIQQTFEEKDPLEFSPSIGIANLGGSKEAYISVLLAYYQEGVQKLKDVPAQFASGDISLYTTNVHALKSSSATVGCMGISPMFKALEFAGKDGNTDFISENSDKTFELFEKVIDKVRTYLEEEDALEEIDDKEDALDDVEIVPLDMNLITELSQCIATMNLRRSEEIISELSSKNFGKDINSKINSIKTSYENFEYFDIKTVIEELL